MTRQFTARNDGFWCLVCGSHVPPSRRGYRNHCSACLSSLHVDRFPGDRANTCGSIMDPIGISQRHGTWMIHHRCRSCGAMRVNMTAGDDAWERVTNLAQCPLRVTDQPPAVKH